MADLRRRRFSSIAIRSRKRAGRQATHQVQTARSQIVGAPGRQRVRAEAARVGGGRLADATCEEGAEAPEAREADLEADLGHGMPSLGQQQLGAVQTGADPELVWRDAECRLELPDEVKRRDTDRARHVADGRCRLARVPQQTPGPAETPQALAINHHGRSSRARRVRRSQPASVARVRESSTSPRSGVPLQRRRGGGP